MINMKQVLQNCNLHLIILFVPQPPSLLPRSVASKGIFTCKICGTAHVSWDEFSRHFLLAHGSVPRILLKYKCVPCNVSFAFRENEII